MVTFSHDMAEGEGVQRERAPQTAGVRFSLGQCRNKIIYTSRPGKGGARGEVREREPKKTSTPLIYVSRPVHFATGKNEKPPKRERSKLSSPQRTGYIVLFFSVPHLTSSERKSVGYGREIPTKYTNVQTGPLPPVEPSLSLSLPTIRWCLPKPTLCVSLLCLSV